MFIVNPGAGNVPGETTEENARANIEAFLRDVGGGTYTAKGTDDTGRYTYEILIRGERLTVSIPGVPLPQVRYMGERGQNIWDFPRLYVDDSSWVWVYAVSVVKKKTGVDTTRDI